jgi:hypothetical protein
MNDPVRPLLAIAAVQALGLAVLVVSVLFSGSRADDEPGLLLSGVAVYGLFLAGMLIVIAGLRRRSRFARGPFIVAQLFGLVAAWMFLRSGDQLFQVVGIAVGMLCLAGLVLALRPATMSALQ